MDIYIARGEERNGPYSEDSLRQFLADGQLDGTELAYHEGLDEWANVRDVIKEIPPSPVLSPLPPLPRQSFAEWDAESAQERYEMDLRRRVRKMRLPGWLFGWGGIIYGVTAQAKHFGYSWYGWKPADVTFSDQWHWYISGAKEPIIAFALIIVGMGLLVLSRRIE